MSQCDRLCKPTLAIQESFGRAMVDWPYGKTGARISTSTALSLAALQDMHSIPPLPVNGVLHWTADKLRRGAVGLVRLTSTVLSHIRAHQRRRVASIERHLEDNLARWIANS